MTFLNLFFYALASLLLESAKGISSTPPVWTASDYFKSGSVTFVSTNSATGSQNLTVTYSTPIINTDLKVPTLGITDLGYQIPSNEIQIYVVINRYTTTYLRMQLQFNQNTYVKTLKLTYMALDNTFTPPFSMNYFFPRINRNSSSGFSVQYHVNFTRSTGVLLDTTHENVLLPFMHYIYLRTYDTTIDLNLDFILVNGSYYRVTVSTTSHIWVRYAGFSRIIFDKTAIEAMGNDYFNYGIVTSTNDNTPALQTTIPPDIIPSNLYYGMHSFNIQTGLSELNFTSAYTINTGAIGFTQIGTYSFAQMKWSYMHHKTRTCPASHPYYNISQILCYDQCAVGWYGDLSTMTCKQCLYDCYTCTDATTCATCNSSVMHRALSLSRCPPEGGYYDDGTNNPIAQPCTSPCATCVTTATFCLTCVTGYYISGSTCLACSDAIVNCTECTNASFCTLCNHGGNGTTCTVCASHQFLTPPSTCTSCASVITNCLSCTSSTTCTLCQATFTLHSPTNCGCSSTQYLSTTCLQCSTAISNCASCSDASTCTGCVATFTLLSPTSCACGSTTFLNTTTSQCEPCTQITPYCQSCTSVTCNTCMNNLTLDNATSTCVCSSGNYANSSTLACQSCSIIPNCLTCDSASVCTSCATGYKVNTTSNLCIVQPCTVPNCDTCVGNSTTVCQSCYTGFSVETAGTSCLSYCGNSAIDSSEVCDDGNAVSGDGCSSTCTVETGFSCYNQVVNASSTYSACFYTGAITFSLVWIRKFQGNNSLKFEFKLDQEIQQWASVDFRAIMALDQVDTANLSTGMINQMVSGYYVGYKAEWNRFWVIVDYVDYDMEETTLSFELAPYTHNTYPAFTVPSNAQFVPSPILTIVTVVANNNQNSKLYSDYEYNLYYISVITTYIVVGLAIVAVIGSLIFRVGKIITFEMITVMQITFFSIASLDSINPVFSGLLPLRFLVGILNFRGIEEYLEQTTSPNAMKGIYMFLNLSSNFSWVAAALACFIGLGGVFLLIYFIIDYCANSNSLDEQGKKPHERRGYFFYRFAFHFIGEIGLSLIFFCVPLFMVSLFFEALFTQSDTNFGSYAQGFGVGIAMVAFFIALLKSDHPKKEYEFPKLGEYISEFSKLGCFQLFKYPNFQLIQILLISGLIMATIYSNSKIFSAMCIVSACVVDIVIVAVVKPYKFGFVSCFMGEGNETEMMFEKIELFKVYQKEQPTVVRVEFPDLSQKSDENPNENNSEMFAQHFATKKKEIKSKHQGLVTAGETHNETKLFLFNNNTRRIVDLVTIIVVQFIFICAKIYSTEINKSYPGPTAQNLLPLIIHIVLFLNVVYNYGMLLLQIVDRKKDNVKVHNEHEQEMEMDTNEQFNKSLYTQSPKKVDLESNLSAFPKEKKYGNSLSVYENHTKKADEHNLSALYHQKKNDLEDNDSGLFNNKSLGTTNSRLMIKNNNNPAASSMYDLKRPQIVRADRIKRKHQKNTTNITAEY